MTKDEFLARAIVSIRLAQDTCVEQQNRHFPLTLVLFTRNPDNVIEGEAFLMPRNRKRFLLTARHEANSGAAIAYLAVATGVHKRKRSTKRRDCVIACGSTLNGDRISLISTMNDKQVKFNPVYQMRDAALKGTIFELFERVN